MADVEVTYRGQIIRSMSASGTEVLHTEGKYCDDDITIDYTSPGGGGANLQTKSVTYTPDETGISDTILPDPGYDGMDEVDVTVAAIPDTYIGSAVPQRDSSDLLVTGRLVRAPAGYYASMAGAQVALGTEGTPTASKEAVSNHSVDVTPSVTNGAGYISGGTQTGMPVTVSASELVSGSQTVTVNDTYDVTNLAELVVAVSGGGSTVVASGTFTGAGSYSCLVDVGDKMPIRDGMFVFWADTGDEFTYNTTYKIVNGASVTPGDTAVLAFESTQSDYDRWVQYGTKRYDINNSGTITQVTIRGFVATVTTLRNAGFGNMVLWPTTLGNNHVRKYSDRWSVYLNINQSGYAFPSTITYNWKLIYFGSDPSNDIVEIT